MCLGPTLLLLFFSTLKKNRIFLLNPGMQPLSVVVDKLYIINLNV